VSLSSNSGNRCGSNRSVPIVRNIANMPSKCSRLRKGSAPHSQAVKEWAAGVNKLGRIVNRRSRHNKLDRRARLSVKLTKTTNGRVRKSGLSKNRHRSPNEQRT